LDTLRFIAPFGGLVSSDTIHWKARSGLPSSVNRTFFTSCYDSTISCDNSETVRDKMSLTVNH